MSLKSGANKENGVGSIAVTGAKVIYVFQGCLTSPSFSLDGIHFLILLHRTAGSSLLLTGGGAGIAEEDRPCTCQRPNRKGSRPCS